MFVAFWAEKCSGKVSLPEHTHVALLDRGSLWKVSLDVTAFPVVENDFKIVAVVLATKTRSEIMVSDFLKTQTIFKHITNTRDNVDHHYIEKEIAFS